MPGAQLDKMKLQLCLVFLFLSLKGSYSTISSYSSPVVGWSYLCGCASRNQLNTSIQMKCKENEVIQMEPRRHFMGESVDSSNDYCGQFTFKKCSDFRPEVLDLENRTEIFKKCTLKNSCDIKIAGVENGQNRLVNYPFYCHSLSSLSDISVKRNITKYNNHLYLIGEHHTGQKSDCDCVFTSPGSIYLVIYFIHLKPTSCSKVKFRSRNVPMFECSTNDTTILHGQNDYRGTEFRLEIRDMEPDKEDVLYFRLFGSKSLSVNCTGCTKSKGFQATDLPNTDIPATDVPATDLPATDIPATDLPNTDIPATDLPATDIPATDIPATDLPATDIPATDIPATDLPNTDIPATDVPATYIPSTDIPATDIPATDLPNTEIPVTTDSATGCSISTGNTDHSNNDNYPALFGGVIASIMVINTIGIGIFCLIRKRKKPNNVPNEPIPPVVSSNDYADFHHPIGTDHPYQDLVPYLELVQNPSDVLE